MNANIPTWPDWQSWRPNIVPSPASPTAPEPQAPPARLQDTVTISTSPTAAQTQKPAATSLADRVKEILPSYLDPEAQSFIPKAGVDAMCQQLGCSPEDLLRALVPAAKEKARPPVSQYFVGAAGLGKSGSIYLGINTEYANLAIQNTTHGEQGVCNSALTHGESELVSLAISADPCGHCRQFLNELVGAHGLKILLPPDVSTTLPSELPKDFGPKDLGVDGALLAPKNNGLTLAGSRSVWSVRNDHVIGEMTARYLHLADGPAMSVINGVRLPLAESLQPPEDRPLADAALSATNRAYAPYSKDPSGIAIRTADGKLFNGAYAENAAFNPSLNPIQSALINMALAGEKYEDIRGVALVEPVSAGINPHEVSQVDFTLDVLHHIAPDAILSVYGAEHPGPSYLLARGQESPSGS